MPRKRSSKYETNYIKHLSRKTTNNKRVPCPKNCLQNPQIKTTINIIQTFKNAMQEIIQIHHNWKEKGEKTLSLHYPHALSAQKSPGPKSLESYPSMVCTQGVTVLRGSTNEHHCRRVAGGPFDLRGTLAGPHGPFTSRLFPHILQDPRSKDLAVLLPPISLSFSL